MEMEAVATIFRFMGGLGMFLYGMNAMADGLQKSAGDQMQRFLGILTANRFFGVISGAVITAILQSSSAATVMVVGFVNAGVISLVQAAGIIMGANIGTTITSWLVSMSQWSTVLKPEFFAPLLIGAGAGTAIFAKSSGKKQAGEILVGIGLLFTGLDFISSSVKPYRDAPVFFRVFQILGRNPILGILAGAAVTALIQSSSASVGILQTLALNGVVNWRSAVFITLGQNIGTCVTALLSGIGAHRTAKRAAVIHLLFNCIGAVIFGILMAVIFRLWPGFAAAPINSVEISVFHTIFNLSNTILLFPFSGLLVKLSFWMIKDREKRGHIEALDTEEEMLRHLDERILETPSLAVEHAGKEVVRMGRTALINLKLAKEALLQNHPFETDEVMKNEATINHMEKMLMGYLVRISDLPLSGQQHLQVRNLLYTISDIERIGDHCQNLAELAQEKIEHQIQFSEEAKEELEEMFQAAVQAVSHAVSARESSDRSEVRQVAWWEEKTDKLEKSLRERHIRRLSARQCQTENGVIFLDAVSNLERVSDHAVNIAGYVEDELQNPLLL